MNRDNEIQMEILEMARRDYDGMHLGDNRRYNISFEDFLDENYNRYYECANRTFMMQNDNRYTSDLYEDDSMYDDDSSAGYSPFSGFEISPASEIDRQTLNRWTKGESLQERYDKA